MNDIQCSDRFRRSKSDPGQPSDEGRAGKALWAEVAQVLRSKGRAVDHWKPCATKAQISSVVVPFLVDEQGPPPPRRDAHPLDEIERRIGQLRIGGDVAADVMEIVRNVLAR